MKPNGRNRVMLEQRFSNTPELSDAERDELKRIDCAVSRSAVGRVFHVASAAALPVLLIFAFGYLFTHASDAGLALCKRWGTHYIPEEGALEKLLRSAIAILSFTAIYCAAMVFYLEQQRRLMHKLVTNALESAQPSQPDR